MADTAINFSSEHKVAPWTLFSRRRATYSMGKDLQTARRWALRGVLIRQGANSCWGWLTRRTTLDVRILPSKSKQTVLISVRKENALIDVVVRNCNQNGEFVALSCECMEGVFLALYFWSEASAQIFMDFVVGNEE